MREGVVALHECLESLGEALLGEAGHAKQFLFQSREVLIEVTFHNQPNLPVM